MSGEQSKVEKSLHNLELVRNSTTAVYVDLRELLTEVRRYAVLGAGTDGAHHKHWCLVQICAMFGITVEDQGIAP